MHRPDGHLAIGRPVSRSAGDDVRVAVIAGASGDSRVATAAIARLHSDTGQLRWVDADSVSRASSAGDPAPEPVRRPVRHVLAHQADHLQDDASTIVLERRTRTRGNRSCDRGRAARAAGRRLVLSHPPVSDDGRGWTSTTRTLTSVVVRPV